MMKILIEILVILILVINISCKENSIDIEYSSNISSCQKGKLNAEKNATNNYYKLLSYGYPICTDWDFQNFYEEYILQEYGVIIGDGGCVIDDEIECYTDKMSELIYKKFGDSIFIKAKSEALIQYDKILQIKIDTGFIFGEFDTVPSFLFGIDSLNNLLSDKFKDCNFTSKKIYVSFIINKRGKVSNSKLVNSNQERLDCSITEITNSLKNWKPAMLNNQKVNSRIVLPIEFIE